MLSGSFIYGFQTALCCLLLVPVFAATTEWRMLGRPSPTVVTSSSQRTVYFFFLSLVWCIEGFSDWSMLF